MKIIVDLPDNICCVRSNGEVFADVHDLICGVPLSTYLNSSIDNMVSEIQKIPKKWPMTVDYEAGLNEACAVIETHRRID